MFLPASSETTVVKSANKTVTSSTTLQNDNELLYAMDANTNYIFEMMLLITGATAGDMKFALTVPSGGDLRASGFGPFSGTTSLYGPISSSGGTISSVETYGTTNPTMVFVKGVVMNGSTAGDLQLQWAQNASSATATTVYAKSYLKVW